MLEEEKNRLIDSIRREIDSGSFISRSRVYSDKYFSNIDYLVDHTLSKHYQKRKIISKAKRKLPWKEILPIVLTLFILLTIIPQILPPIYGDFGANVTISLDPSSVYVNDTMFINATIPVYYNITSVSIDMNGIDKLPLSLTDNNTENYLWQTTWIVPELKPGNYLATITALDINKTSYQATIEWIVLIKEYISTRNVSEDTNITDDEDIRETVTNISEKIENVTILETKQQRGEINKPVKWTKEIRFENNKNQTERYIQNISLPDYAEEIKVFDKEGAIIEDIISINLTEEALIQINDTLAPYEVKSYLINYTTPAPTLTETIINSRTKRVVISSDIHYTNILAFITIDNRPEDKIHLYHVIDNNRFEVNFTAIDLNNDTLINRIEWVVPHLSEQIYDIVIEITKAEHLDENRSFISDIYNEVKSKDDVWSEPINGEEYARVTFKKALGKGNDITIFARSGGSSDIEVYTLNDNTLITTFEGVAGEDWYKVYLSNMTVKSDVFDLRIAGDSVELDYIVDPYVYISSEYTFSAGETQYIATCPINETDFIIVWMDGSSTDDGKAVIGRINPVDSSISYGDVWTFDLDVGVGLGIDVCLVNSTSNRFFIVYADDDDADDGFVTSATFSGLTITPDSKTVEFDTTDVEHPAICKIRDDYAVVCYNDEGGAGTDVGSACVVYWDGSNLQTGTAVELGSGTGGNPDYYPFYTEVEQIGTDKFACGFVSNEAGSDIVVIGSVSGTTITMGAAYSAFDARESTIGLSSIETNKVIMLGSTAANQYQKAIEISGLAVSGTPPQGENVYESDQAVKCTLLDSTTSINVFADEADGDKGKMYITNISWGSSVTMDMETLTTFNDAATNGVVADYALSVCRLSDTSWVVAYQDDADSDYGKCVFGYTNLPPIQSNPGPSNGATNQVTNPTLNITVDDPADKTLTAIWRSNSSGAWFNFATNNSMDTSSGEVNIIQVPVNFTNYSTTYWWSVNLTDGTYWSNETYSFTTEVNVAPSIGSISPANESTDNDLWPSVSVTVTDNNDDTMTVYFYENTTSEWVLQQTNSSVANNTNVVWGNYTNASSISTTYWWSVNVTDGELWTNETYHFTTYKNAILNITINTSSMIDCDCTVDSPCTLTQNEIYWFNITVKADGEDSATYGSVDVGVRTNWSGGDTMNYINTTVGSTPFYVNGSGGSAEGILNGTWYYMNADGSIPVRMSLAMTYDSNNDRSIVFGGSNIGGKLNDTWLYNYSNNTWYNANPSFQDGTLIPRDLMDMAYDSVNDRTVLFGGCFSSTQGDELNDTWLYNYSDNTWYNMSPYVSGGTLTKRSGHAMTFDSDAECVILFGGWGGVTGFVNDTWAYSFSNNTWFKLSTTDSGGSLPRVTGSKLVYDPVNQVCVLFGGQYLSSYYNETWVFYYNNATWVKKNPDFVGGTLETRVYPAMAYDSNAKRIVLFGGTNGGDKLNDTWVFNINDNTWYNVNYSMVSGTLSVRSDSGFVYDSSLSKLILFGGSVVGGDGRTNETWVYNYTGADLGGGGGGGSNPENLGTLSYGNEYTVNFSINATGTGTWRLDVNVTSNNANVVDNQTCTIYVTITEPGANNEPTQINQKIWNSSSSTEWTLSESPTGVSLYPTSFNVTINDADAGDTMNITLWTNESGSWLVVNQSTGLSSGTYNFTNTSWIDSPSTKYWIAFNLTDGTDWINSTYYFTAGEENTTIDIIPDQWDVGTTTIGNYNYSTSDFYFNLTNNGTVPLNIQIMASNATNATTGARWNLTSTPGFNNFSLQYNKSGGGTWTNINTTYDTFVTNLGIGAWQTFDLNIFMAINSTKSDPLSLIVTFRSVAV